MNLWDIVTANSSLPVQSGNTFWDHLNNQQGGGPIIVQSFEAMEVQLMGDLEAELEAELVATLEEDLVAELDDEIEAEVCV